jgi:hypothetical protein
MERRDTFVLNSVRTECHDDDSSGRAAGSLRQTLPDVARWRIERLHALGQSGPERPGARRGRSAGYCSIQATPVLEAFIRKVREVYDQGS